MEFLKRRQDGQYATGLGDSGMIYNMDLRKELLVSQVTPMEYLSKREQSASGDQIRIFPLYPWRQPV